MSWSPPRERGGLKGGFQPMQVASNPFQVSPFGSPGKRRTPNNHRGSLQVSGDRKISAFSSPSNSESQPSSAAAKDYIQCALDEQFGRKNKAVKLSPEDCVNAGISEQVENDVQRILEEQIDFQPARSCDNQLLTKVQQRCTDISKIPLVKFTVNGKQMRGTHHTAKETMCEKQQNSSHANIDPPVSSERNTPYCSHSTQPNTPKQPVQNSPTKPTTDDRIPEPRVVLFPESSIKLEWPRSNMRIGCGLQNLGNTCFLNATLQCLAYTPPLFNFLVKNDHRQSCRIQGYCVTCKLQEFLPSMLRGQTGSLRPFCIAQNLRVFAKGLTMGRQEDAHEFLRLLIDAMRRSALFGFNVKSLDIYSQETTITSRIFGGFYRSRVQCSQCKHPSNVYDPFMDIPLDIGKNVSNLSDALKAFIRVENLTSPNNLYKCERCKRMTPATKQVTIHKPPNILTLQFKRFLFNGIGSFSKIDKAVEFPERLNLKPYMSPGEDGTDVMYKLYAVLVHSGGSCHSGHYFAFVNLGDSWYRMDDTQVHPVNRQSVLSQRAYLLFYLKVSGEQAQNSNQPTEAASVRPVLGLFGLKAIGPQTDSRANERKQVENRQKEKFSFSFDSVKLAAASGTGTNGRVSVPASPSTSSPFTQRQTPMFKPRVIAYKPPVVPKPASQPPITKSLVPYAEDDDDEETARPEPVSSKSSTSSDGSKENREFSKSESPAREIVAELSPQKSFDDCVPVPAVEESSSFRPGPSPVRSQSSNSARTSEVSGRLASLRLEQQQGTLSKKERKRLKRMEKRKLRRTQSAFESVTVVAAAKAEREQREQSVPDSGPQRKKKKKKRQRNSSGSTTSSSPSWVGSDMVWVEKDRVGHEGQCASTSAGNGPQPEPALQPPKSNKKFATDCDSVVYGADVRGWNGERSLLDIEADLAKAEQRKRAFEESDLYEQELDMGRSKKPKHGSVNPSAFHNGNGFQRYQNGLLESNHRSKSIPNSQSRDLSKKSRFADGQNRRSASR